MGSHTAGIGTRVACVLVAFVNYFKSGCFQTFLQANCLLVGGG